MKRSLLLIALATSCSNVPPAALAPDAAVTITDGFTAAPDLAPPIPPGSPRIVQRVWTGSDGSKIPLLDYYDSKLGVRCSPADAEPGAVRCLPFLGLTSYYSDSACTQPVAYVTKGCTVEKYAIVRPASVACQTPQPPTFYRVSAMITPTKLYLLNNSSCVDVSAALTTTLAAYTFYDTNGQEPLTSFLQGRYGY